MPGPRGPRGPKPKIENPGKLFKRIIGYVLKDYAPQVAVVVICIFVGVLANVQGTLFMQTLIDSYIVPLLNTSNPDFSGLAHAIARVACFYAVGVCSSYLYNRIMINVSQGTMRNIRNAMFGKMEKLPIKYFDTHAHGDIMSCYTNDIDTLRQMISQSMPQCLNSAVTIVTVLISMFSLSVPLTFTTLVMVAVMLFVTKKATGLSGRYFLSQQKSLGAVNGFIEEMMEGQKVVKVFCHEEENIERFNVLNDELFDSAYNANRFSNMLGPINLQLGNVSYVVCAIVGGILAIGNIGGFTLGGLASFLTFNKSFNMPINQVSMQFNSIIMALAGADRVFKLIDEQPEDDNGYVTLVNVKEVNGALEETDQHTGMWAWKHYHKDSDTTTYQRLEGDVVFDDVDFGYNDDKMVLHNIKMFAEPGQKIAFVGSTGAGKTTINVNKIKKADLRRSLGIVLQDTHLFTATVMENIRYGKLEASDEEVIAAAKLANAHGFIERLPQGYDTLLTGDGANLSQGQRQLLALARAAIADPPALILDEATSSIDTRTEKIVQDGMDKLMKDRTTFVIAHRLSTVKNSDCIMVLEQGRIIERGTHDELIAQKGRYYQLYTGNAIATM